LVAAERIQILGGGVRLLEMTEISRIAIMIENEISIKIVHLKGAPR
jgi:hypothetical protein